MHQPARSGKWLWGISEWEATKAASRPLAHAAAVVECAALSEQYRQMWQRKTAGIVDLDATLETLRANKIAFVLTGAHGFAGWTGRPRATWDVDILVRAGRNYTRAVNALRALYPNLEVRQTGEATGFFVPGTRQHLVDLMYPHRADLQATLETGIWIGESQRNYRIPTLEAALANKYGAMRCLDRDPCRRALDLTDFCFMVKHTKDEGRQPIDLERLRDLGEKAWTGGGGAELIRLVEAAKAGKLPTHNTPDRP
jgi:hypothetical protein